MKLSLLLQSKPTSKYTLLIYGVHQLSAQKTTKNSLAMPEQWQKAFLLTSAHASFQGKSGQKYFFNLPDGQNVLLWGLGDKSKWGLELLRKEGAKILKEIKSLYPEVLIDLDSFVAPASPPALLNAFVEGMLMANYTFERYKSKPSLSVLKSILLKSTMAKGPQKIAIQVINKAQTVCECINFARDLVNEAPNYLNSVMMAKLVVSDAKKLPQVKCKVLDKAQLQKEKMGLFLAVNAGSAHPPRLVHLTYHPKTKKNLKHLGLVGKGLTFDTGGYSLKPAASMENMKTDMAGAATVYAAFRAAALLKLPVKLSCYLGITDNALSAVATTPDSIVQARNGKTVEILNTDAEGRLVLADVLDYACNAKPDYLIDAATLTGAVLTALGSEVAGMMSNNQDLAQKLLSSAQQVPEYLWQLPIIPEFSEDLKSHLADLRNIGNNRGHAGSSKGAAFLQEFISHDIPWAHLDIAGVADSQGYLPYCPKKGASGLITRTLLHFIESLADG